ncbi:MAG: cardiolipin synthase ClsB [Betaproteobacteria bacterium]|jgi:cardiolipin synthase|nr:cardiolipin synthase ClsB [Betaproteobacteria bacterium]
MRVKAISARLRTKASGKWLRGNTITLLENGEAFFPALLDAIDAAQQEILLQTYIFATDATGLRVTDALARAAARGVSVRVLVDGFGGLDFVRELMNELSNAGVETLIFRRELRPFSLHRQRLRRLHRKVTVIDGRIAFVGGINIIDDFDAEAPEHPRYDYAVRVEGTLLEPILISSQRLRRQVAWTSLRHRIRGQRSAGVQPTAVGDMRAAFLIRDNLRHRSDIENAYLDAIAHAHEEIVLANAYFFPGRRFRHALLAAATRGVKITLLLQGVADHPMMQYATRALYPVFLENGIRLFEYQRSVLHAKVAVIDHHWATVGSSNIDPFSLMLAREANVAVIDRTFAATLEASLAAAIRDGAVELRREDWARQPIFRRLLCWLAYHTVRLAAGIAGIKSD